MTENARSRHPLSALHDPATIRARCAAILQAVEANVSEHFTIDRRALPVVAARVAALTLKRFPDLHIPYHSRWRHFEAGGLDRKPQLDALLAGRSVAEVARAHFDLTVVSVLLDAGAGAAWNYTESGSGQVLGRSEGLGVASWHAFINGAFSSSPSDPLRADATALAKVDAASLRAVFQSSPSNPMVGLEGRAGLLARLGMALKVETAKSDLEARPSLIYERLTDGGTRKQVAAVDVLDEVLRSLGAIWTSGSNVKGLLAGDVWPHRWAGARVGGAGDSSEDRTTGGYVPFHKLSQWLSYSLLEPLQWAGVEVTGLDALTGLPEYRNGGLLLDGGVIKLRHPGDLQKSYKPSDDFVVEWRALTVSLLDEVAVLVRQHLGKSADELPLACILEGGTWAPGARLPSSCAAMAHRRSRSRATAPSSEVSQVSPGFGPLLRRWRTHRRLSQMTLALQAEVSSRHLSCLENGKTDPSRAMVLRLGEQLDLPLRERNALLVSAGYAPMYRETPLDDAAAAPTRAALQRLLDAHEPWPALAVDRHWNLIAANRTVPLLMQSAAPELLQPPANVLRLSLHPRGLAPLIENLADWHSHVMQRLRRQWQASGDVALGALHAELMAWAPAGADPSRAHEGDHHDSDVAVPLIMRSPLGRLSFITTLTVFGAPHEVTLSEIAIETLLPADADTAQRLRDLTTAASPA